MIAELDYQHYKFYMLSLSPQHAVIIRATHLHPAMAAAVQRAEEKLYIRAYGAW